MNVITEIKMTHKPTMERINRLFPGRLVNGHISGLSIKPQYRWTLDTNKTREFLVLVLPYLVTKLEEAKIALQLCERGGTTDRFDSLASELKACRA